MTRYIEDSYRRQTLLMPECVDYCVDENNPARVDSFVDLLDLADLGFERAVPAETRRPAYHPGTGCWTGKARPAPSEPNA